MDSDEETWIEMDSDGEITYLYRGEENIVGEPEIHVQFLFAHYVRLSGKLRCYTQIPAHLLDEFVRLYIQFYKPPEIPVYEIRYKPSRAAYRFSIRGCWLTDYMYDSRELMWIVEYILDGKGMEIFAEEFTIPISHIENLLDAINSATKLKLNKI